MKFCESSIKSSRKRHLCNWCAEIIDVGESYDRYRWCDGGDCGVVKMHPECLEACDELAALEGGIEFWPGEHKRGSTEEA